MQTIKLIKKTVSVILTSIDNIDYDINEVIDNSLLDEKEYNIDDEVYVYNMLTNRKSSIYVEDLTENHILVSDGKLYKIVNMFEDYK